MTQHDPTSDADRGPGAPASGGAVATKAPPTSEEQRSAIARLVVVLAAAAAATIATGTTKTVLVVVALIAMIMLHEFGHYITARLGGMKVTEFFVGFGPRLWSIRKGETEYGVKALPLGGYVKIIGMHNLDQIEDPADESRTYRQQTFPRRLAVALAGSTMHFIIAFALFAVINVFIGIPTGSLRVGEIMAFEGRSPALDAGLQVGDRIVSVAGQPLREWDDLREYVGPRPEQDIPVVVERDGSLVELNVRPIDERAIDPAIEQSRGLIGIRPLVTLETTGPVAGLVRAGPQLVGGNFMHDPNQVAPGIVDNAAALGHIFSPAGVRGYVSTLTGGTVGGAGEGETRFLSPVGFVRVAGQAADTGLFEVLLLLIAINIFVGLFNLLPLLPLDGGHVAIAVYEAVRTRLAGRRYFVDVAKLLPVTYAVVLLLVFLGVSALYLDIVRPLNFR